MLCVTGYSTVWCFIWNQYIWLGLVGALCTQCSWVNYNTKTTGIWSHLYTSSLYFTVNNIRISRDKNFKDQSSSAVNWILRFPCALSILLVWMLLSETFLLCRRTVFLYLQCETILPLDPTHLFSPNSLPGKISLSIVWWYVLALFFLPLLPFFFYIL